MNDLIDLAIRELALFLEVNLQKLSDNWWSLFVVPQLSHEQQRQRISKVSQLDFAALLRVLDHNWITISNKLQLPIRDGKNWIKELQTVRNNWSHRSASMTVPNDLYRDIDTLERVLKLLCASAETMHKVADAKKTALQQMVEIPKKSHQNIDAKHQTNTQFPQADSIRQHVLKQYILPARKRNESKVEIRAGDVHRDMQLSQRMPAVCSAIGGKKFLELANVKLKRRTGPNNGANVYFLFQL